MKSIWSYLGLLRRPRNSRSARNSRSTRSARHQPQPLIEPLENRVMLSTYTTSSYTPLPATTGAPWVYSGTADGVTATATTTNAGTVNIGPVATTNVQTVTVGASTSTLNDYETVGTSGLELYRQDFNNAPNASYSEIFPAPVTLLPGSVSDSQTYSFNEPESGTGTFNGVSATWLGTFSGTMTLASAIQTVKIGTANIQAIEVTETATFTDSSATTGFTNTGTVNNVFWFGLNIGLVKYTTSSTENINGSTSAIVHSSSFTLSSSPLLTSQIAITGNSTAITPGETSPAISNFTDFGNWGAGSGILSRTYTITNNGSTALNLIGSPIVQITGADASDFSLTAQPSPTSLAPGATSTFTINFNPPTSDSGERTATITVGSTDPVNGTFTFEIQGDALVVKNVPKATGLQYASVGPNVTGDSVPISDGQSTTSTTNATDFGLIAQSATGAIKETFTVANPGTTALTLGMPTLPTGFTLLTQPAPSLKSGMATTFTVELPATTVGVYSGNVSLPVSGSGNLVASPFTFAITGTVAAAATSSSAAAAVGPTPAATSTIPVSPTTKSVAAAVAKTGDNLSVNYSGYLTTGLLFDSSLNPGRFPFRFTLGAGQVIKGWDEGLVGMKVGETRTLIIPSALGYGANGSGSIPANAELVFNVTLLAIQPSSVIVVAADGNIIPTGESSPTISDGTDLGAVNLGQVGTSSFTINENGKLTPRLTGTPNIQFTTGGADNTDFIAIQPTAAGSQLTFSIEFKPLTLGPLSATVTIQYTTSADNYKSKHTYTFEVQGEGSTDLFDPTYYLAQNPTVAAAVNAGTYTSAWQQYWLVGQYQGAQPDPYFNPALYIQQNPDVAAEVTAKTYTSGFAQFVLQGQNQIGYINNMNVFTLGTAPAGTPQVYRTFSNLFNETFYLAQNPDVASAIVAPLTGTTTNINVNAAVTANKFTSGFEHFVLHGVSEGREFSPLFDETIYLDENPDVAAAVKAGVWASGFQQYETDGINEGRAIYPLYNEAYYLAQNPTVAAAVKAGTYASGFAQFITTGIPATLHYSPYFNESDYLAAYPDVAAAVTAGQVTSGFQHYVLHGQFEGRTPVSAITAPTAALTAANVTTAGAATYQFTVVFSDPTAVNVSTLNSDNIQVVGPNSFAQPATFVSVTPTTSGTPLTATYRITAPAGAFSAAANGTYTITLEPYEVADTWGIFVPAGSLGTFSVNIAQ